MTHELEKLENFAQVHPPREPFEQRGEAKVVYQHPHARWKLSLEATGDIGYGIWREEELANAGISGAEADAQSFADDLYAALSDQLSMRNLEKLAEVFSRKRDEARKEINAAKARLKDMDMP